jgi:UDP-N-acetylmuramyl pentapeptide phosphotransferase/UDP-N-acetylglucosamine-1-phosphate transferase
LPIILEGRTASHSIARLSQSGLPNMGGLVLYMVTCIYTFRADQGSLEILSKDFPCVRYVVL